MLALVIVPVVLHLFGVSPEVITYATGAVVVALQSSGLMHAGDSQEIEQVASSVTKRIDYVVPVMKETISKVKDDLTAMHNVNAQSIAVHDAKLAVVIPPVVATEPVTAPAQMKHSEDKPHLVEG